MKKNKSYENVTAKFLKPSARISNKKNTLPPYFVVGCIAMLTLFIFSASLKCGFVNWDDNEYVLENPLVVNNTIQVKEIFQAPVSLNYHPITMLTLALNYKFGKLNPQGYHLWNVLLHVLNTLLVFILIFKLTKRNLFIAVVVSLFFGIHPMHVESVAWISERKDVLYVFFFLLGLISYIRYKEEGKTMWYIITLFLFILSCLSKAMAVVFPVILLLIDYFRSTISSRMQVPKVKNLIEKIPFFLISIIIGVIAFKIQHDGKSMELLPHFNPAQRMLFACYGTLMYIVKLVLPYNLSAYYPYPESTTNIQFVFYLSPFLLLGLLAGIYILFKKDKAVIFGFLFYFVSIVLVLQFIAVGRTIMSERYSYLSYIGLLFVVAHLVDVALHHENSKLKQLKYPLAGLLIVGAIIFSFQAYQRIKVWMNGESLWTDVIKKYPENEFGYDCRGEYYQEVKHDDKKALDDYNMVLKINPNNKDAYNKRGGLYAKHGEYENALADFSKATDFDVSVPHYWINRSMAEYALGKKQEAKAHASKAQELGLEVDSNFLRALEMK